MEEAEAEYEGLNVHFRLKPLMPDKLLEIVHELARKPKAVASQSLTSAE